jgi:hypothetical protein
VTAPPGPGRRPRTETDTGMVTAETAVALPALAAAVLLVLAVLRAGTVQVRVTGAARLAAAAVARGVPVTELPARLADALPAGAVLTVTRSDGDTVRADVSVRVRAAGFVPLDLPLTARSVALVEPGVP